MFNKAFIVFTFLLSQNILSQDTIYPISLVDSPPQFSVCNQFNTFQQKKCFEETIKSHISENIQFPQEAFELGISGRVLVYFTIESNGKIDEIKSRSPHESLKKEAKRLITILPKLGPAKKDNIAVKVSYSLPIDFFLISRPSSSDIKIFAGANVYSKTDKKSKIVAVIRNDSRWSGSTYGDFWMIDYITGIGYVSKEDVTVNINLEDDTRKKNDIVNLFETNFDQIEEEVYVESSTINLTENDKENTSKDFIIEEIIVETKEQNIKDKIVVEDKKDDITEEIVLKSKEENIKDKIIVENKKDDITEEIILKAKEENITEEKINTDQKSKNATLKQSKVVEKDNINNINQELAEVREMLTEMKTLIQKDDLEIPEENKKIDINELAKDLIEGNISQADFFSNLELLDEAKDNNELISSIQNLKTLDDFLNLNILTQSIKMKSELLQSLGDVNNKESSTSKNEENEEVNCTDFTSFNYSEGRQNIVSSNKFNIVNNSDELSIFPILGSSKSSILVNIKIEGKEMCFDSDSKILISFRDGSTTEIRHESYENCNGETVIFLGKIFGNKAFQDLNELKYKEVEKIRIWMKNSLKELTLSRIQSQELMFTIDCLSSYMN